MNEVLNPYAEQKNLPARSGQVEVESSRSVAEVQAMVAVAKRFPRNPIDATERILNECQRAKLAEAALYTYSRGGTEISGPSIRLAEAIARNWGNLEFGIKEIAQGQGQSEMLAYCLDLENNVRQSKTFVVKHIRYTKRGSYNLEDPRDTYEVTANQGARRLRACILGVIPGDVVDAAVAQCEQTLKAKADTSAEAVKKMVDAFKAHGVTKEHIEKRIQRRLDAITPAQVIALRKIYTSLQDGMSSAGDWFEVEAPAPAKSGTDALKDALKPKVEAPEVDTELMAEFNELWVSAPKDAKLYAGEETGCPRAGSGYQRPGQGQVADWVRHCKEWMKNNGGEA